MLGAHDFVLMMILSGCNKPQQNCSVVKTDPVTYHLNICGSNTYIDLNDWIGFSSTHYHTIDKTHYHKLYVSNRYCQET